MMERTILHRILQLNEEHELKALEVLYNGKIEKLSKKAERELAKRIKWTVESDEDEDFG